MDPFRVKCLFRRAAIEILQHLFTGADCIPLTDQVEPITTIVDFYAKTTLDLAQMLVELAADVGQLPVICGLQDQVEGFGVCRQISVPREWQ